MPFRARPRLADSSLLWLSSLAGALLLGAAPPARAQAWTPADAEGTLSISYQNYYLTGHYSVDGRKTPNGATHSKAGALEFDYGLTDRLALSVVIPFISSKYTGPRPSYFVAGRETFPGPLDDGAYHGALQDFRLQFRYRKDAGRVTLTPLVGLILPSHDYETIGEAVPGRNRLELQVGASVAVPLEPILPSAQVELRYVFAAAEKIHGYPATRSLIELEVARPLTSRVDVRGLAVWQLRHKAPGPAEFFDDWVIHDRFMVSNYTNLGVGVTVWLTSSTNVSAVGMATVSGNYGAHIARLLNVGFTWSFGRRFQGFGEPPAPPAPEPR